MIQNILGILTGALITLIVLIFTVGGGDKIPQYVTALVIGGICNFLWPLVAGIWLARRAKERRNEQIQKEVDRQIASQGK
ncbi:MAG: hypothetical protein U0869_11335 [Chloroflexota bacterium]